MNSGIYKITNIINNKVYIGSSQNLKKRFYGHIRSLRKNEHKNKFLQNAFNKYGEQNFTFEIIKFCDEKFLIKEEQKFIDIFFGKNCYNISPTASSTKGIKISQETKEKLRIANTGRKFSDEVNKKKASFKGFTDEQRLRISENRKQNTNNVYLINIETGEALFFDSVTTCAQYIDVKPTRISKICLGKRKQTKGFTCVYEKDYKQCH